ncbi:ABC transporter substrate-binding protein [Psychrobium sp. 1_MG-2023]|uniref:ABC transporter substrate-binding protein n=1 Tax=Psychrobium sp. 1_MG-2023 TaxID=3062624 RepID=UPI000C346C96|nr:ABC transporter substrate binding protein [Psychrobium sp. 1_MG-2023]MDP2562052.1 ABC transporter substrate binding protein [Psychrobium sp. 1_MG-2023]PKF58539.1 hypothetical protein CW748_03600 [Alteromonadales bacterium alter-6D02]
MKKLLLLLVLFVISFNTYAAKVLLIHSYHLEYPWVQEYRNGFLAAIDDVSLVEYEMDTKRKPAHQFPQIANDAWAFIQENNPSIVVLADDNALKLLGPRLIEQKIPIAFLGINSNPRAYIPLTGQVTGVLERPLMKRSVTMLKKLIPDLKDVKVMMDNTVTSHAILETSFENRLMQKISGINIQTVLVSTYKQWQVEVRNSAQQGYQAIIIANYAGLKTHERTIPLNEASEWTSKFSHIPVFAFWSYSIGQDKAIGGLIISGLEQGKSAAKKVNLYLRTGEMARITTPQRGTLKFSQHELTRWGLKPPKEIEQRGVIKK